MSRVLKKTYHGAGTDRIKGEQKRLFTLGSQGDREGVARVYFWHGMVCGDGQR